MAEDPYLWLEDITGAEALAWVERHNQPTVEALTGSRFEAMRAAALAVYDADTRIPYPSRFGAYLYNFWQDAAHPRGLWRRTTLEEYRSEAPQWEVLIDVDELAEAEQENWVWAGADIIMPEVTRALVHLSRGGSDAHVIREFDMATWQFVHDGFSLPEAKSDLLWEHLDSVFVGTDFGPGSLTDSGYPRIVKRWRRGASLDSTEEIFAGSPSDMNATVWCHREPGFERTFVIRSIDFYHRETYELVGDELVRLDVPSDCLSSLCRGWIMLELKTDWVTDAATYPAGSVLVAPYEQLRDGTVAWRVVFDPSSGDVFGGGAFSGGRLVCVKLRDVATVVEVATVGEWEFTPLAGVPDNTTTVFADLDPFGDELFLHSAAFDKPPRLLYGPAAGPVHELKSSPALFDADDVVVSRHFATSADGTQIPYFLVVKGVSDGPRPTLLYGYGAFQSPELPEYSGVLGQLWLARGGAYVLANIRGGGEYGPVWHEQALRAGRHKVAEDFAAIADDLVATGVTTVPQLGAMGGSAGGLLIGVMLTQYPERFGALVCQVPLLDMSRFHVLLAGASWIAEFGDPDDPDEWEFIRRYSPYHNISGERSYPHLLITTVTNDDRVHPGHARKMTAALEAAGHRVAYYENTEGGHGGSSNNAQAAFDAALFYEFLLRALCPDEAGA